MNVNLTPELERFVQQRVETGRYNSASEVVREALRLLEQKEQLRQLQIRELRKRIAEGLTSLDRGEAVDGEQFLDELEGGLDELEGRRKAG